MQSSKLGLWKEDQLSTEDTRNRYLFREKNGIYKDKGLDLGAEPPRIKLCWDLPPPQPGASHVNKKSWNYIHIEWGMGASFGHEADVTLL